MSPLEKTHILDVLEKATIEVGVCRTLFTNHNASCSHKKYTGKQVMRKSATKPRAHMVEKQNG